MQRDSPFSNPYGSAPPLSNMDGRFRSPNPYPPRHNSSGNNFRFQQTPRFMPHHNYRHNTPQNFQWRSPRNSSPQSSPRYPHTPGSHESMNNRSLSGSSNTSSHWNTSSERRRASRGNNGPYSYNSPRQQMNFSTPNKDNSCNPGGSNDITLYYSPDMIQDPWVSLKPVPAQCKN